MAKETWHSRLQRLLNRAAPPKSLPPAKIPQDRATLWIVEHATQQEKAAYYRTIRNYINKFGSFSERKRISTSQWRRVIGDQLAPQPGDVAIVERLIARMPEELRNDAAFK